MNVPFNKPVRLECHFEGLAELFATQQISANGPMSRRCESWLEARLKRPARLVTSATHALEMMALLSEVGPGDEVILPSFTFVSTANAFALRGARLRFADNDEQGNILPSEVERLLSPRTKAVMVMDYAGGSADLDRIVEICGVRKVPVFEDAAQAIGATYRGRPLGTIGALGCYSFHDTKNVTSGEGGALLFGSDRYLERAEVIREKGTNRSRFLQGLTDKYTWVDLGSSYILSDLNAAYLYPQLERLDAIHARRGELWRRYAEELGGAFEKSGVRILETPGYNVSNHHIFAGIFPNGEARNAFIAQMRAKSVTCPFHYVALHTSPFGRSFYESAPDDLPGCERLSQCLVRFPLYFNLTDLEQEYVIENAKRCLS